MAARRKAAVAEATDSPEAFAEIGEQIAIEAEINSAPATFHFVEVRRRDEDEWQRVVRMTAGCIGDGRDVLRVPQHMDFAEAMDAIADFIAAGAQARMVDAPARVK